MGTPAYATVFPLTNFNWVEQETYHPHPPKAQTSPPLSPQHSLCPRDVWLHMGSAHYSCCAPGR